jgi:hypothetical protein
MANDRLRDTAPFIIAQGSLTLDQPTRDIPGDRVDHGGYLVGLRQNGTPVPRILHEAILSLVATHLDMSNHVDPKPRHITLAHAAVEQVHVTRHILEQRIESFIEQIQARNVSVTQVHDDAGALGRFDARVAHGVLQRVKGFC